MAKVRHSFEAQTFFGDAGSTAATQITELITDRSYNIETTEAETTDSGDGTSVPLETMDVVKLGAEIQFTMLLKDEDATILAFRAAVEAGTPVALRMKDWSSGVGFDGDVILKYNHSQSFDARQELAFTAKPTKQSARTWSMHA